MADKWSGAAFTAADVADISATTSSVMGIGATATDNFKLTFGKLATWLRQVGFAVAVAAASPAAVAWGFTSGSGANNAAGAFSITAPLSSGNATAASMTFKVGEQVAGSSSTVQTAGNALVLSHTTAGGHLATIANNATIAGTALNLSTAGIASSILGTNKSGADAAAGSLTIQAHLSTGNATPGTLIFQVGQQVAGSSSTVQTAGTGLTLSHTTAGGHLATFPNKIVTDVLQLNTIHDIGGAVTFVTGGVNTLGVGGGTLSINFGQIANAAPITAKHVLTGTGAAAALSLISNINTSGVPTIVLVSVTDTAHGTGTKMFDFLGGAAGATSLLSHTITGVSTGLLTIDGATYGAGVASLRLNGLTDGAGAGVGTITNVPNAGGGNPAFWMPLNIAGTVRYIPCWAA